MQNSSMTLTKNKTVTLIDSHSGIQEFISYYVTLGQFELRHFKTVHSFLIENEECDILFIFTSAKIEKELIKYQPLIKDKIILFQISAYVISNFCTINQCKCYFENHYSGILDAPTLYKTLSIILTDKHPFIIAPSFIHSILTDICEIERLLDLTFTKKELAIIHVLNSNLSYCEIAFQLQISINTLRMHIKNIYKKMQVTSKHKLKLIIDNDELFLLTLRAIVLSKQLRKLKLNKQEIEIQRTRKEEFTADNLAKILRVSLKKVAPIIRNYETKLKLIVTYKKQVHLIETKITQFRKNLSLK